MPDETVHELAVDVDPVLAGSFWVPCSTAHVAVQDVGKLVRGERVAVRGAAGAVGSIAVQLAAHAGAREVLAIVRGAPSTSPAGATVLMADDAKLFERLEEDGGVDLLIDTVGGPGLTRFVDAVCRGGRIAVLGYAGGMEATLDLLTLIIRDVRILPVNQIRRESGLFRLAPSLLARLAAGELQLATTTFPFERLEEAIPAVRRGGVHGRVVLTLGERS